MIDDMIREVRTRWQRLYLSVEKAASNHSDHQELQKFLEEVISFGNPYDWVRSDPNRVLLALYQLERRWEEIRSHIDHGGGLPWK
jgi:hypothetical protein